jgi:Mn-dependent DtxR family transcriptional regulator
MATNILSKTRRKFIKVKDFAEQFDMSDKTVYQMIKNPIFEEAVRRIGSKGIRLDEEKMIEIMEQYYR